MPVLVVLLFIAGLLLGIYAIVLHYKNLLLKVVRYIDVFAHLDRIAPKAKQGSQVKNPGIAYVKVVVFVPDAHAEAVRNAIGEAGGGKVGNYSFVTFSSAGIGRFRPEVGSNPNIGTLGKLETIEEERIEFTTTRENLEKVISAIQKVHPYEEQVIDVYPIGHI